MRSTREYARRSPYPSRLLIDQMPPTGPLSVAAIEAWMQARHQHNSLILRTVRISVGRASAALPWEITVLPKIASEYIKQHDLDFKLNTVMRVEAGIQFYRARHI